MQYLEIKGVNKKISRIFCGTATKPYNLGGDCCDIFDSMLALGVNTFDTARVYGGAERALGKWIARGGVREKIVILSKCCHPNILGVKRVNARAMRADLKKSLEELGTDYIDVYLLHRDNPSVPAGEIVEALNAIHAEGRIGAFGGSNWTHERLEAAQEYAYSHNLIGFSVSSPNFSLAEQVRDIWGGGVSISGASGAAARQWYKKNGMAVIAYSSLARGLFSGKAKSADPVGARAVLDKFAVKGYFSEENFVRLSRCEELARIKGVTVAQAALAYVLCQPFPSFAAVSCSRAERMSENLRSLDVHFTADEIAYLELEKDSLN